MEGIERGFFYSQAGGWDRIWQDLLGVEADRSQCPGEYGRRDYAGSDSQSGEFSSCYGLEANLRIELWCGSPQRAADEAACVMQAAGERLVAFQVGNEADFFGGRPLFREKPYDFEQYFREYREFVDAVRAGAPALPLRDRIRRPTWTGWIVLDSARGARL